MKKAHMKYLVCPECNNSLDLLKDFRIADDSIESGKLKCINYLRGCSYRVHHNIMCFMGNSINHLKIN